jgi:PKD repeat protein
MKQSGNPLLYVRLAVHAVLIVSILLPLGSCDLEEIAPQEPDPTSDFIFEFEDPDCSGSCTVLFTNLSENAESYAWEFGDGSATSTDENPEHTYTSSGEYVVTLTASRGIVSDDTTFNVVVPVNVLAEAPPIASFTVELDTVLLGDTVKFTNNSANTASYEWDFGDDSAIDTTSSPVHVYDEPGNYEISLTAISVLDPGLSDDTTFTVTVLGPPVLGLSVSTTNCVAPCVVDFTNTTENADTYLWNFNDDSEASTVESPSHVFNTVGTHNVKLTASNSKRPAVKFDTTVTVTITRAAASKNINNTYQDSVSTSGTEPGSIRLNNSLVNGNKSAVLVVNNKYGRYVNTPVAVEYKDNGWYVNALRDSTFQDKTKFNILVKNQDDADAFEHTVTRNSLVNDHVSLMDHPFLNRNPDARVFVTALVDGPSTHNTDPVTVVYVKNKWAVMSLTENPIPVGARFHVYVNVNDSESFVHTVDNTGTTHISYIDNPLTNEKPDKMVFHTANQGTELTPVLNEHVTGVWYYAPLIFTPVNPIFVPINPIFIPVDTISTGRTASTANTNRWSVYNEDRNTIIKDARFNILVLE